MSWGDTLRALGEALIEVLRAELEVLGERLKRSGRQLAAALGVLAMAATLLLVCVPALVAFAAVAGVHALGLPLWAAALVVTAVVAGVAAVLLLVARYILTSRFENPAVTVRRRLDDHRSWWSERVLPPENRLKGGEDEPSDTGGRAPGGEPPASREHPR